MSGTLKTTVLAEGHDEESMTDKEDLEQTHDVETIESLVEIGVVQAIDQAITHRSVHDEDADEMNPGREPGTHMASHGNDETTNGAKSLHTAAETLSSSSFLNRIEPEIVGKTKTAPTGSAIELISTSTDYSELSFIRPALSVPGSDGEAITRRSSNPRLSQMESGNEAHSPPHPMPTLMKYDPGISKGLNNNHNSLDRLEGEIMEKFATRSKTDDLWSSSRSGPGAVSVGGKSSLDRLESDVMRKSGRSSCRGGTEEAYEDGKSLGVRSSLTGAGSVSLGELEYEPSSKSDTGSDFVPPPHFSQTGVRRKSGNANLNEVNNRFLVEPSGGRVNLVGLYGESIPGSLSALERDFFAGATGTWGPLQSNVDESLGSAEAGMIAAVSALGQSENDVDAQFLCQTRTLSALSFRGPCEAENTTAQLSYAVSTDDDASRLHRNFGSFATSSIEDLHSADRGHSFRAGHDEAGTNQIDTEETDANRGVHTHESWTSQNHGSSSRDDDEDDNYSQSLSSRDGGRSLFDMEQPRALDIHAMVYQGEPVTMATSAFVVTETEEYAWERRRLRTSVRVGLIAVAFLIAVVAIIAASVFGRDESSGGSNDIQLEKNTSLTQAPSFPPPSPAPSSSPTTDSHEEFLTVLRTIYHDDAYFEDIFSRTDSAQYRAAEWVADEDLYHRKSFGDPKVLQRFALATFYFSTLGDDWDRCYRTDTICNGNFDETSWLSNEDECIWDSIDCDDGVNVSRIFFLPQAEYALRGTLPRELAFLSVLDTLIVSLNEIGGTIPESLSSWTNLKTLRVDSNLFSGTLPASLILNNPLLGTIHVQNNKLTGTIPNTLIHASLRNIQMQGNQFVGTIPGAIAEAEGLVTLYLEDNDLKGEIPAELYGLSDMTQLRLGGNIGLTGQLTPNVQMWKSIQELSIAGTHIDGTLPSELFNLTTLKVLDLGFASLSGTLQDSFANLKDLSVLSLNNNTFSGKIPVAFDFLTNLATLEIHGNNLVGTVSNAVCDLRGKKDFELHTLSADCLAADGKDPLVSCGCCTVCFGPP